MMTPPLVPNWFKPASDWESHFRTGQPCPDCGHEIVYNGNYFCSQLIISCRWAMGDGPEFEGLFRRCYDGLMSNRRDT
jgi:hypothetical protein